MSWLARALKSRTRSRPARRSPGRASLRVGPWLELLEDRLTPAIHFTFIPVGDAAKAFLAPGSPALQALDFAGNTLLGPRILTHLAAIQPGGTDHWTATFPDASAYDPKNPTALPTISKPDLAVGDNEVVVFVMMNDKLAGGHTDPGSFSDTSSFAFADLITGRGNPK